MIETLAAQTTTDLALLPGFMDPITLLGYFGHWALAGLLLVILIESGVLFPVLPGDSLLFVAGMVVAGESAEIAKFASLWQLLIFIPIAAIIGGQIGYWIGRYAGTSMFKPDARFLKEKYLVEAHEFFEKHGPITIFLARFVPIVRTLAPIVAGAARMRYSVFFVYNVVGAIVWGCRYHPARVLARPVRDRAEAHRADLHSDRAGVGAADRLGGLQAPSRLRAPSSPRPAEPATVPDER